MATQEIYKIRHKVTGLFSMGGTSYIRWAKTGKIWKRTGDLSSHFTGLDRDARQAYKDAEVVKFVIVESEAEVVDASVHLDAAAKRKYIREEAAEEARIARESARIARQREQLERDAARLAQQKAKR